MYRVALVWSGTLIRFVSLALSGNMKAKVIASHVKQAHMGLCQNKPHALNVPREPMAFTEVRRQMTHV